jgi:hypothetical protein
VEGEPWLGEKIQHDMKKIKNNKLKTSGPPKGKDQPIEEKRWSKENIITIVIVVIALIILILWGAPHFDYYPGEPKVPPFR